MYSRAHYCTATPLLCLHATQSDEIPLVCIPGAGASVTVFIEFVEALGGRWPAYGLQPCGINAEEQPHESVEAAALYNLDALARQNMIRPIHLMGHSHGGLVAFDMALRLCEQGQSVASLTLIDSDPPDVTGAIARPVETLKIFREFVQVYDDIFGKSLDINESVVASLNTQTFLETLHTALVREKCIPSRSSPYMLSGPFATFAAALRTAYCPSRDYPGRLHLVLVRDSHTDEDGNVRRRQLYSAAWRCRAHELHAWYGPGHHFSILQPPHVHSLASWWREARETES